MATHANAKPIIGIAIAAAPAITTAASGGHAGAGG